MARVILTLLNGLALGSILFIVSAGLTFTFGVMRILNLAHGALYMIGAYVGWAVAVKQGLGFGVAVVAGGLAAAVLGVLMERGFLRHLHGGLNEQTVLTFGVVLILTNLALWIWGPEAKASFSPGFLTGTLRVGDHSFPTARLGLIVTAAITALVLWTIDRRTLIGARVRAGRDDRETLEALGVNFDRLAMGLFAFGALLAGMGGVLGAQVLGANLGLSSSILLLAVAVVVVGGLGSVAGALLGAMLVGIVQAVGTGYFPGLASFTTYLVMVLILVVRPTGLLGSSEP
jgi:branched-chain amino acid transport system permease protein